MIGVLRSLVNATVGLHVRFRRPGTDPGTKPPSMLLNLLPRRTYILNQDDARVQSIVGVSTIGDANQGPGPINDPDPGAGRRARVSRHISRGCGKGAHDIRRANGLAMPETVPARDVHDHL